MNPMNAQFEAQDPPSTDVDPPGVAVLQHAPYYTVLEAGDAHSNEDADTRRVALEPCGDVC
jgi:hypothetical protein